jgi:hypothetical protein
MPFGARPGPAATAMAATTLIAATTTHPAIARACWLRRSPI